MTTSFGPSYVRAIAPYVAGKPISEVAREFGLDEARIVKLASNENPLGMPDSAKTAMAQAASELGRYPDANAFELKAALAEHYDVPAEWITLGNGSNDILELAAHAFVEKSQSVVYAQYSFAVYALATQGLDLLDARLLGRPVQAVRARAAVLQAGLAFALVTLDPLTHRARANAYGCTDGLRRLPA